MHLCEDIYLPEPLSIESRSKLFCNTSVTVAKMRRCSLSFLSFLLQSSVGAPNLSSTTVRASTEYYTGQINENYTNVREFLNVPYGETTAGKNRFMPPIAVPMSDRHFDATEYAKACPQYVSAIPSVWNQQIPQYLQYWGTPNNSAGESAVFATEDCLSLAIWTPANATAWSNLPVALFWTGGGFQTNGILVPGQLPSEMDIFESIPYCSDN